MSEPGTEVERVGQALTPAEQWLTEKEHLTYTVLDDGRRMIEVDDALQSAVTLLGPVANIIQVSPNWSPQLRPIRLRVGEDTNKVGFAGGDEIHDLSSPAWAKLGELSGIERHSTHPKRWPNGQGMTVTVTARKRGPDGNWIYTRATRDAEFAVEAELIEIDALEKWEKYGKPKNKPKPSSLDIRKLVLRMRQFMTPTLETKAYSRCVKALLGVVSFRKSVLQAKPLMAIAWVMTPDLNDAGSRALVQMQYDAARNDLFVDEPAELALSPGDQFVAPISDALPAEAEPSDEEEVTAEVVPQEDEEPELAGGEWDIGETDAPTPEELPAPPKPEKAFRPSTGPFAGKAADEIVQSKDGRLWLVEAYKKLNTPDSKQLILAWLSFGCKRPITSENLKSVGA